MLTSNPYSLLTEFLPPLVMQVYVVLMILAVAGGTAFDLYHKRSAEYFARRREAARALASRRLGAAERIFLAIRTLVREVATSGEFCKWPRRLSHLLMMYGFLIYLVATLVMVFGYAAAPSTPVVWTLLWHLGALMVLGGGGWFFFLLRVDVAHEHHPPLHLVRADLFIGSLLTSVLLGLIWHFVQWVSSAAAPILILFALYIFFTTLLFVSVPWSKFAHMFYKPVAAFQRRVEAADGSSDLPRPWDGSNIGR